MHISKFMQSIKSILNKLNLRLNVLQQIELKGLTCMQNINFLN
jgi:hypothetical protein